VTVSGDEMTVDLTEVGPQVNGFVNCGETAGRSGAEVAFKTLTTPGLRPVNDGAMRPLKIITAPNTVITADKTAAMRMWMVVPDTVVDTIWKAVTPIMPTRGPAGHHGALGAAGVYASVDPSSGRIIPRRGNERAGGITGGGWGAVHDADGQCATICINDGDTHAPPVEAGEAKASDLVLEHRLRTDSGGPGRFRGGLGAMQRTGSLAPAAVDANLERTRCAPWGVLGGKDGLPNRVAITRHDGRVETFRTGIIPPTRIDPGDSIMLAMGGGGGFGDPLDREPWQVLEDVRDEYVSLESAERDYGVVIAHPAARRYELNEQATEELRARRRANGGRAMHTVNGGRA
jgi:N-methylhydantoinase B